MKGITKTIENETKEQKIGLLGILLGTLGSSLLGNMLKGRISIISFASVIGAPAGIASASFSLVISLTTGNIKKQLKITGNKKKKHNKIVMLAKSKLNSIETLVSQALIDLEISHE